MTEKWRTTVSIDEDTAEHIQEDEAPFSPLVNKWAEDYYLEQRRPAMKEQKAEEMIVEIEEKQEKLKSAFNEAMHTLEDHKHTIRQVSGTCDSVDPEELESVYNQMTEWVESSLKSDGGFKNKGTPRDPNNPAIKHKASMLGMSPEKLVEELVKRDVRDGFVKPDGIEQ